MNVNGSKTASAEMSARSRMEAGERIESAIDEFETHWPRHTGETLCQFVGERKLADDLPVLVELVRVDIERRYEAGLQTDLETYWGAFPILLADRQARLAVAYEDYRSRCSAGLSRPMERWSALDGIQEVAWYRDLDRSSRYVAVAARPPDVKRFSIGCVESVGFRIVARIGEGSMSEVFLAKQRDLADRHVVLKVVDRPLAEPHQMARLQHTNIVPIYSFHRTDSHSILCMPYAGMLTLADYFATSDEASSRTGRGLVATVRRRMDDTVNRFPGGPDAGSAETAEARSGFRSTAAGRSTEAGRSPGASGETVLVPESKLEQGAGEQGAGEPAADDPAATRPLEGLAGYDCHRLSLLLFSKLASALTHAHARGVLHGDLKPANVLIRNDGEPALLDFNLSIAIDREDARWAGGTLAYMAPEVIRAWMGQHVRPEPAADIYGLGVMLFEFVNGVLPFHAPRSCAAVDLEEGLRARHGSLRWTNPAVSPGTRSIVARCLAGEPSDRYRSAAELQADLDRELKDRPLRHASEPFIAGRARKWARRHPRLGSSAAIATAALLAIAFLTLAGWRLSEANRGYAAREHYERFMTTSARTAADLLMPGPVDGQAAIGEADRLFEAYHLLSDDHWASRPKWSYLLDDQRASLQVRIADLLVRSISRRLDRLDRGNSVAGDVPSERAVIAHRLDLLRKVPFRSHAPASLNRLEQAAGRIAEIEGSGAVTGTDDGFDGSPAAVDRLADALERISRDRPREALERLSPTMLETIDAFSYWVTVGQAQMADRQLRAAELSFTLAIRESEDVPAGHYCRGVCRRRLGRPADLRGAESDFTRVLTIDPARDEAQIERAIVREVLKDFEGAVSDLDAVIRRGRHTNRALVLRARVYGKLDRPDDARRDLDEAIRQPPQTAADWLSRGFARLPSDPSAALADFRGAETLKPDSSIALQNQAFVLSEHLGDEDAAIVTLTRLLDLAPTFEPARMGRAVLRARSADYAGALEDLRAAETHSELSPAALYQAACVHALAVRTESGEAAADAKSRAVHYLSRAIRRGYGGDVLDTDPDLEAVRDDHRFHAISQTLRLSQPNATD